MFEDSLGKLTLDVSRSKHGINSVLTPALLHALHRRKRHLARFKIHKLPKRCCSFSRRALIYTLYMQKGGGVLTHIQVKLQATSCRSRERSLQQGNGGSEVKECAREEGSGFLKQGDPAKMFKTLRGRFRRASYVLISSSRSTVLHTHSTVVSWKY